jgi:type I restriction enzyme M protein
VWGLGESELWVVNRDLDEFVSCYHPENRHELKATWSEGNSQGHWRPYRYENLFSATS